MIVKNEEKNLPNILNRLSDIFDQVVIMDTGSTDQTLTVLKHYKPPVEIFQESWVDDFASSRNRSFTLMRTDLILWIDGDDIVPDETLEFLRGLKKIELSHHPAGYQFCYHYRNSLTNPSYLVLKRLNLVRRDSHPMWEFPVYEQLTVNGMVVDVAQNIYHIVPEEVIGKKNDRNKDILFKMLAQDPHSKHALFYLSMIEISRGNKLEALRLLKDLVQNHPKELGARIQLLQLAFTLDQTEIFLLFFSADLDILKEADISILRAFKEESLHKDEDALPIYEQVLVNHDVYNPFLNIQQRHILCRIKPLEKLIQISRRLNRQDLIIKYKILLMEAVAQK